MHKQSTGTTAGGGGGGVDGGGGESVGGGGGVRGAGSPQRRTAMRDEANARQHEIVRGDEFHFLPRAAWTDMGDPERRARM